MKSTDFQNSASINVVSVLIENLKIMISFNDRSAETSTEVDLIQDLMLGVDVDICDKTL